ncbi:MAG: hypothetical protein AAGM38_02680 [Pseudomonadota bacterium]
MATGPLEREDAPPRPGAVAARSAALAAIGGFMFLPATLSVVSAPATLFGAPLIWVFIFIVWASLILGAAALAQQEAARERTAARRRVAQEHDAAIPPGA